MATRDKIIEELRALNNKVATIVCDKHLSAVTEVTKLWELVADKTLKAEDFERLGFEGREHLELVYNRYRWGENFLHSAVLDLWEELVNKEPE